MKPIIKNIILNALEKAHKAELLPSSHFTEIIIEEPKAESHGDFSTNIAMTMASVQKMSPKKIAEAILSSIDDPDNIIKDTQIAGPGFINFFINTKAWYPSLAKIFAQDTRFGSENIGKGKKIQVEFVSANPTGPLHVGHGRGAAVGDAVARILSFTGYNVEKEYYVNDSGRQIKTLGTSVFLRYKSILGVDDPFPDDCYQGEYITDIAKNIHSDKKDALLKIDENTAVSYCSKIAAEKILTGIKKDLNSFDVIFDNWFSEQSLFDSNIVKKTIDEFKEQKIIYEKDGALWFKTSDFGDEKDRVVVRNNGITTYFASDIAYHREKFLRGYDEIIDVWGADHHGYINRIKASIEASGTSEKKFHVILIQLVNLLRNGKQVAMSTRSGQFISLKDVIDEVGKDAARFIFLSRHYESPLDFDLEVAKKKTNDNPVYYVQYVHARISSILRKAEETGKIDFSTFDNNISDLLLNEIEEIRLIKALSFYPDTVKTSALQKEPHKITFYLMNLASLFHSYYNKHKVLTDDPKIMQSRLYLVTAVLKTIRNGLTLLGISAPKAM